MSRRRILPVFVPHQGCPFQCVFCNQKRISGCDSRADEGAVKQTLQDAGLAEGSAESYELAFYGGSFTAISLDVQTELLTAASDFVRRGGTIRLSTRPDAVSENILTFLKKNGVTTIEIGCQSLDEEVLRLSGRGHTEQDCVRAAQLIKSYGFELVLQMMTGLPGDTAAKSISTARKLIAMKPDAVRIYPAVIVKDTPLYEMWLQGQYKEHTVEEAVEWCGNLIPIFQAAGIPVIRLGLNPTDELSGGQAAGGAYHPALGELVMSRVLLGKEITLIEGCGGMDEVTVLVHPKTLSAAIGQKKCNRLALHNRFPDKRIVFKSAQNVMPGEIAVEKNGHVCYN